MRPYALRIQPAEDKQTKVYYIIPWRLGLNYGLFCLNS